MLRIDVGPWVAPRDDAALDGAGSDDGEDERAIRALVVQAVRIEYKFQEIDRRERGPHHHPAGGSSTTTGVLTRDVCRSIIKAYASHVEAMQQAARSA